MGDFGKILDEWESMRRSGRSVAARPKGGEGRADEQAEREWFARELSRYPIVDKDAEQAAGPGGAAGGDAPSAARRAPVQDRLDLHGMTLAEAITATDRFIATARSRGLRKVLIIHGKGRDGEGLLKREVRAHLERHEDAGAMGYAKGTDGGRGALWVVIRSRGGGA
ncbi:MAG: Smr/MutS family protein [Spirochaetota bacterium]